MHRRFSSSTWLAAVALALTSGCACGDDEVIPPEDDAGADASDVLSRPDTYSFPSRFVDGESSVAYSGQVFRQTLNGALKNHIAAMTNRVYVTQEIQTLEQWTEELDLFYRFDPATTLDQPIGFALTLPTLQTTWADISSGANLFSKTAGEDDVTDHMDWDNGAFVGWAEGAPGSPVELIDLWFGTLAQAAVDRAAAIPNDPFGNQIEQVYITATGQDLQQLIQKFLLAAVTFSQGSDDYLDSGTVDKGLETSNLQDEDNPYSTLEHQWDEGFGYFGARRDYGEYTVEANADPGYADTNGDGMIDLQSELSSGMAINAAKRDRDSQDGAKTNFADTLYEAMIDARFLIWENAGAELTAAQKTELEGLRDTIVANWEAVFAATVIHYINETITQMDAINGAATYSFTEHAKVWGEMKGFAFAFQFNPRSRVSVSDFAMLHTLMGDAPVVTDVQGDLDTYVAQLIMARDILQTSFGFDQSNVENW